MPARKRHYNNLLDNPALNTGRMTTLLSKNPPRKGAVQTKQAIKTKADIFISALLYGALERI